MRRQLTQGQVVHLETCRNRARRTQGRPSWLARRKRHTQRLLVVADPETEQGPQIFNFSLAEGQPDTESDESESDGNCQGESVPARSRLLREIEPSAPSGPAWAYSFSHGPGAGKQTRSGHAYASGAQKRRVRKEKTAASAAAAHESTSRVPPHVREKYDLKGVCGA